MQWLNMEALVLAYYCNFDMCDNFETRRFIWLKLIILRKTNVAHFRTATITLQKKKGCNHGACHCA